MLDKLPEFPRLTMRRGNQPGYDKEIWQPSWRCYCCHDTGIVQQHLAALVIKGYNPRFDKQPVCQNPNCNTSPGLSEQYSNCLDFRLNSAICQKLDMMEQESWRDGVREKQRRIKDINAKVLVLSKNMSMRESDRTPEEEMEAQRKHYEVIGERKASGE